MIINSILGAKKSVAPGSSLILVGPYGDFIRSKNEELLLEFEYSNVEELASAGAYFADTVLIKNEILSQLNSWDVTSLLSGVGPRLITFRVIATDYRMESAKIDFRVIYDYKEFDNMVFELTENGNLKMIDYIGLSEVVDIFEYSYLAGYGIKPLTQLDGAAFYNKTGIKTIRLPESIMKIGNTTFTNCSDLSLIEIYAEIPPVLESTNAFDGTESGLIIKVPQTALEDYQTQWAGKINGAVLQAL